MFRWESVEEKWRKDLLWAAKGEVLEIGAGTGQNFKYYQPGVNVTAVDSGNRMIEEAKKEAKRHAVQTKFIVSPVGELQLPSQRFDTIVSTFSLGTYKNPENVLLRFSNWCKPAGTILLLEYGLSKYGIVRWTQKKIGPYYYRKTGSYLEHDMVTAICRSGLRIKKMDVKYAGVVHLVWAALVINK